VGTDFCHTILLDTSLRWPDDAFETICDTVMGNGGAFERTYTAKSAATAQAHQLIDQNHTGKEPHDVLKRGIMGIFPNIEANPIPKALYLAEAGRNDVVHANVQTDRPSTESPHPHLWKMPGAWLFDD
jgi:hypothetical protein